MQSRKLVTNLLAAGTVVILLLAVKSATATSPAQAPGIPNVPVLAGTVSSKISYQGRLADAEGNALNGNYDLVFQLWDDATGGKQIGEDIVKDNVPVNNGLFTVELDIAQSVFNGQALWLRSQVEGQWLSPRQALQPVPYALSLRPGALISGTAPILTARSQDNATGELATSISTGEWPPTFIPVGVRGEVGDSSGIGVEGQASGNSGIAIRGLATGTGDATNYGGYFEAHGTSGRGIAGAASGSQGCGVYGYAAGSAGYGVYGEAASNAIYGRNTNNENVGYLGGAYGAYGESTASYGRGVFGLARGDLATGVFAEATGNDAYGVYARASDGARGVGLYAEGSVDGRAADFKGNVRILSPVNGAVVIEMGEGLDYAEGFHVSDKSNIEAGSVLSIDPNNPGKLSLSNQAYDTRVAGIVAGANGLGSAVRLGAGQFDYDVALAGRVYCNVDATYGQVSPGDLLTTSPTAGYAMVASNYARAQGAILGKAMEGLASGKKGQILVLVTLQ